jgi:hypothetical protein
MNPTRVLPGRPALLRLAAGLAVLFAALAAIVVPAAGAASAFPPPPPCFNEIDTYKSGQTIHAYAFKSCDGAPVGMSLALEIYVCDEFGCMWATWKTGIGNVSYTCPGTFYAPFRSTRLKSKIVYCNYF